jgi:hypothetical protein
MTVQSIVENIKTIFPNLEEQRIIKDLSDLQKSFANETRLLTERATLSSPSSNVAWVLPSNFVELYGEDPVRFYNSENEPLYLSGDGYNYRYEIQFGRLYIYSLGSSSITGLSSDVTAAYVHYHKSTSVITVRTDKLEIEDQFTKALEHGLLSDYFSKIPTPMLTRNGDVVNVRDLQSASWHLTRYTDYKIKAKIYAKKREYDRQGDVQIYQDAGKYQLVRRTNDLLQGSITPPSIVPGLGEIYTKYVLYHFTFVGAGVITPHIAAFGFIPVATKTGNIVVITSIAEFGIGINVISNDGGTIWTYNGTSQLTIELPDIYSTIAIEIWER